jgi:hypothetical protein
MWLERLSNWQFVVVAASRPMSRPAMVPDSKDVSYKRGLASPVAESARRRW